MNKLHLEQSKPVTASCSGGSVVSRCSAPCKACEAVCTNSSNGAEFVDGKSALVGSNLAWAKHTDVSPLAVRQRNRSNKGPQGCQGSLKAQGSSLSQRCCSLHHCLHGMPRKIAMKAWASVATAKGTQLAEVSVVAVALVVLAAFGMWQPKDDRHSMTSTSRFTETWSGFDG